MDIQTGLVCVGFVVLSGAVLLVLSMFGMQKKTYEEAIAEQRKMPEESLILGRPTKDKSKDKKPKRQGKKVKEKVKAPKDSGKSQSSTETDNEVPVTQKEVEQQLHVNFVIPEAEVMPSEPPAQTPQEEKKGRRKKDKVKPILVNKDEQPMQTTTQPTPQINNFEQSHPKDEFELHQAFNKADQQLSTAESDNVNQEFIEKEKIKPVKSEAAKTDTDKKVEPKNQQKPNKNEKAKVQVEQIKIESESVSTSSTSLDQSPVQQPKGGQSLKDQKKKKAKSEMSLQLMTERDGVNIHILKPLIQKAELSRSEVQDLTDLLLNRHFDSELAEHSEWFEGRQDPMVKLKKQLAEKEKALTEEQEASQAFQNKLKELRAELNGERSRMAQACRQYDDTIMAKQTEVQGLHGRLKHVLDSHVNEKQALTQKLQQLQAQVNEDSLMIRKVQEDHGQTHNALQQEIVNQRQQMEMHITRLNEQHQESENSLKAQIHAQLQELEQLNTSLNTEVQTRHRYEEELKQLTEQHLHSQTMVKTLETRATHLKESSNQTQELARQIEELQRANKDLEKRLNGSHQVEEELKFEKTRLQNEYHGLGGKLAELQGECDKLKKEKDKIAVQAANRSEVDNEVQRLKEENQCLISQVSSYSKLEIEAQQLREENESLAAQVTAFTERPAAEGRENGDTPYNEEKKQLTTVDMNNHENEVKKKKAVIEQLEADLKEKHSLAEKLNSELLNLKSELSKQSFEVSKYKTDVDKLQREVDAQRSKNNDLRQRNWKAMEALNTAEKALEAKHTNAKQTDTVNEAVLRARLEEQASAKNLLLRLFPDVNVEEKPYEQWSAKFESAASSVLQQLAQSVQAPSSPAKSDSSSESSSGLDKQNQLQALVTHYKKIIDDTEGMLNKLQSHIEREEIRWGRLLQEKEQELEELRQEKQQGGPELETTVMKLEEELTENLKDKEASMAELTALRAENDSLKNSASSELKKLQQLSEDKDALSSKLAEETEKIKELNKELVKLRSNLKIGQDSYADEHKRRIALEEQLRSLSIKNNHEGGEVTSSQGLAVVEDGSEK